MQIKTKKHCSPIKLLMQILAINALLPSQAWSKINYGWYSIDSNESDFFYNIERKADRTLNVDSGMTVDIGIGPVVKQDSDATGVRHPIRFKIDEIKSFLKAEKHKNLLVVWFDQSIMWNGKAVIDSSIARIKQYTGNLGYSRVVIFGIHCCGYIYLSDTTLTTKSMKK